MGYRRRDKQFDARLAARRDELAGVSDRKPRLNYWRCLGLAICLASAGSMISLAFVANRAVHAVYQHADKPSPAVARIR
jgi:hypothetical protein